MKAEARLRISDRKTSCPISPPRSNLLATRVDTRLPRPPDLPGFMRGRPAILVGASCGWAQAQQEGCELRTDEPVLCAPVDPYQAALVIDATRILNSFAGVMAAIASLLPYLIWQERRAASMRCEAANPNSSGSSRSSR